MAPSNYRLNYPSNMSEITITIENSFQYNENQLAQANRFKNEEMITNRIQHLKLPFFYLNYWFYFRHMVEKVNTIPVDLQQMKR